MVRKLFNSRMRYQDPEGDYGRQTSAEVTFSKIVEKVLSLNSVSHYQDFKALTDNTQNKR